MTKKRALTISLIVLIVMSACSFNPWGLIIGGEKLIEEQSAPSTDELDLNIFVNIEITNNLDEDVCTVAFDSTATTGVDYQYAWNVGEFPPGTYTTVTAVRSGFYDIDAYNCSGQHIVHADKYSLYAELERIEFYTE